MAATSAVLDAPERITREEEEAHHEILSYKCEECGKIIAAPVENPTPTCCGGLMRNIG
jgi:hypothetical protein